MSMLVLEQPELLLTILAYLPQQDLLLSQRVCRMWKNLITSSRALQEALFFRPSLAEERDGTETGLHNFILKLNPLLQDKFPPFFDHDRHVAELVQAGHNLGPWKSIYWYRGRSRRAKYPLRLKGAKERMTAYARAEASWRRMIPCSPAPTELQMHFGTGMDFEERGITRGSLKCLKFPQTQQRQSRRQSRSNPDRQSDRPPPSWLTFGLLYDLLEQAWFCDSNMWASSLLVDMTYEDPLSDSSPPTPTSGQYHNTSKTRVQVAVPERSIGGPGKVLIHITDDDPGGDWAPEFGPKKWPPYRIYLRDFKSAGSELGNLKWDEEFHFDALRR